MRVFSKMFLKCPNSCQIALDTPKSPHVEISKTTDKGTLSSPAYLGTRHITEFYTLSSRPNALKKPGARTHDASRQQQGVCFSTHSAINPSNSVTRTFRATKRLSRWESNLHPSETTKLKTSSFQLCTIKNSHNAS